MHIAKVSLTDLQPPASGIASAAFTTASELLAVSLARFSCAVVSLASKQQAAMLKAGLSALLANGTASEPGYAQREWRVGGPADAAPIEEAYGILETVSRAVLSAVCRSSLLRLRADAFSGLLDDLPLSRGVQGSSLLSGRAYVNNFQRLLAAPEGAAAASLAADPQEEVSERGLLGVFYLEEATDKQARRVSGMQVRVGEGQWADVTLAPNEVVVVLGHSLQHATAGLLPPGVHRVVGDPYGPAQSGRNSGGSGGSARGPAGRRLLHFDLRPHPAAVLDLRAELEAAGHTVSRRFSPVSVRSLMEQFESLLSPAAKVATPDQQQGAAAHAAWDELQATLRRSKKRTGSAASAEDGMSVDAGMARRTRSQRRMREQGEEERAAEQQQQQQQQQQLGQGAAMKWEQGGRRRASGGSTSSSGSEGEGCRAGRLSLGSQGSGGARRGGQEPAAALYFVRGRTCTVLDGCLADDPAACLTLCVRSFTGLERWFYLNASTSLGRLFEMYCARLGISLGAVKFLHKGSRVYGAATPAGLEMADGQELTVVPEASDWSRQARELGPLFAAVFSGSTTAVKAEPAK